MSVANDELHLAYFITPHGFGHAARACAIMEAIHNVKPGAFFDIFTTVPEWFFRESLSCQFEYHPYVSDIGLIQSNSMQENIEETIQHLNSFFPFSNEAIEYPRKILKENNVKMVFCDISPIAIVIAQKIGTPSILIENFTWDWIYAGYPQHHEMFDKFISGFHDFYSQVNIHIQTTPVCKVDKSAALISSPVSRAPRLMKNQIRHQLGLNDHEKVVLITMGGIPGNYPFIQELTHFPQFQFIIPGAAEQVLQQENIILLPHHSNFFHPDLVYASDLVIGKVGYSTLAETYHAGNPFVYLSRKAFRESSFLVDFIQKEMVGLEISEAEFQSVQWIEKLPGLFQQQKPLHSGQNGAAQIAQYILDRGFF